MPEIVAVGECMIELFSDEPLGQASTFQRAYAGDTNNVLHMAAKLGTSCGYITRVAEDQFGDYLVGAWRANGIDTSAVKRTPGFTAVHFITILPDGEREFIYYRKGSAASAMRPKDLDADYIGTARVLHASSIIQAVSPSCRATALRAVEIARERGAVVSFDTNLRLSMWSAGDAREALDEVIPYVDVVFTSHPDETSTVLEVESPKEAVDFFRNRGVGTIAVTSGRGGALIATPDGVISAGAIAPNGVSDTTGAGDAFVGGFLHCLVQEMGPEAGLRWGIASAGLKVAGRGGIASQPTRAEVEALVDRVDVRETALDGGRPENVAQ